MTSSNVAVVLGPADDDAASACAGRECHLFTLLLPARYGGLRCIVPILHVGREFNLTQPCNRLQRRRAPTPFPRGRDSPRLPAESRPALKGGGSTVH